MSWCDKLASTPTVGFSLTPHFAVAALVDSLAPILDPLVDQFRNPTFTSNQQASGNGFSFTTKDGFTYGVEHSKISIAFQHHLKAKAVSGGPPIMEMLSNPLPYTELLPKVSERLVEATRLLPMISARKIFQVGVVATTNMAMEDIPPGILRFSEYINRPWGGSVPAFNISVTSELTKTEKWTDRCQHTLVKSEDPDTLVTIVFDYHRSFASGQSTAESGLKTLINKCGEDALKYFEDLAEGNRFDEHIISEAD